MRLIKNLSMVLLVVFLANAVHAQNNVSLEGRWGEGRCEAIFRRGGISFVGNGAKLELFRTVSDSYEKMDSFAILPGMIQDIWVTRDTSHIYAACGYAGVQVIEFDHATATFGDIVSLATPGFASGVVVQGVNLYVADGDNGLITYNISTPMAPVYRATIRPQGFVYEVWAVNSQFVLVAAGDAGVYSVNIANLNNPFFADSLKTFSNSVFPQQASARHIISNDTVAYVAAGLGGMSMIDITNPYALQELGNWQILSNPVDVREVWVSDNYATLACGESGVYGPVDVSDPLNPAGPYYEPLNTDGFAAAVVTEGENAYLCDGPNGHIHLTVKTGSSPMEKRRFPTADQVLDVEISGNYIYAAAARSGLKVFSLNDIDQETGELQLYSELGTDGRILGLSKRYSRIYAANGSEGLLEIDVSNPQNPYINQTYSSISDTCYDVDAPTGNYAYLACGTDGMRVLNCSAFPFTELVQFRIQELGMTTRSVIAANNRVYLANTGGVSVYDVSTLPSGSPVLLHTLNHPDIDARKLDVQGDSVYVANGRYGFLIWDLSDNSVEAVSIEGGVCTDIHIRNKTLFLTDSEYGLRIYDLSRTGAYVESGSYPTYDQAQALHVYGDYIGIADRNDGLYLCSSDIKPVLSFDPQGLLDFGPVPLGKSRPRLLWVENTGTELLTGRFSVPSTYANEFIFSSNSFAISPGDRQVFEVMFKPAQQYALAPPFSVTMSIISNDPNPAKDSTLTLQWQGGNILSENNQYRSDGFTIGLWHFDETGGTIAYDASDYTVKLNGALQDDAYFLASSKTVFKNAVRFDGNNDLVLVDSNTRLDLADDSFTYELWFSINQLPDTYAILMQRGINTTIQFQLALGSNKAPSDRQGVMAFLDGVGQDYLLNTGDFNSLVTGHWYHVALTSDGEYLRLFLNGVLKDSTAQSGSLVNAVNEQLGIGSSAYGNAPFKGEIDEVRISNVARQTWEFNVNRSRMELSQRYLDFASVLKGQTRTLPLVISNPGSETLYITDAAFQSASASLSTDFPGTIAVDPGLEQVLDVSFSPSVQGNVSDVLTISSSDPTYPEIDIPVTGEGRNSFPAGEYSDDIFTLGLYHMNEAGGAFLNDASDKDMHGSWPAESRTAYGRFGQALLFQGTHSTVAHITPSPEHDLSPLWKGLTVDGWFYLESQPLQPAVVIGRGDDTWEQYEIWIQNATLYGSFFSDLVPQNETTVSSQSMDNLKINEWYHFALVYDRDCVKLYLNGNLADSTGFSGDPAGMSASVYNDTSSVRIGSDWDRNRQFKGRIDEIRLSNTARLPWEFNVDMARIALSTTELEFDRVLLNRTRRLRLTIANNGLDDMVISNIQTDNSAYSVPSSQFSVGAGMEHDLYVSYTPESEGTHSGLLVMNTNDPFNKQVNITLNGEGVDETISGAYTSDIFTQLLYHFDYAAGDTVRDYSANKLTGRIFGNIQWAVGEGVFDRNALYLNGNNNRVAVPDSSGLIRFDKDFSIELWFNLQAMPQEECILFYRGSETASKIDVTISADGYVNADVRDDAGLTVLLATIPAEGLKLDRWNHINLSWDTDSLTLSLNNIAADTEMWHGDLNFDSDQPLYFGGRPGGLSFQGLIDEVRISRIKRQDWELHVKDRELSVSPRLLDFATVLTSRSRTLQLGVANLGDQDLPVIRISGGGQRFSIPDSLTSFVLDRRSLKVVPVTYRPQQAQYSDYDSLLIVTADTTVSVILQGSGTDDIAMNEYETDSHTLLLYHLNSSQSGIAIDMSGAGLNGTIMNGPTPVSGLYNTYGLLFDGVNDYIQVNHHPSFVFDKASQSFTVECYFKTDTVSQGLIYLGQADSANYGLYINRAGRIAAEGFGAGGPGVADNSWHHAALMYDHLMRHGKIYLDGTVVWQGPWTGSDADYSTARLIIGSRSPQYGFFSGTLDEIRISDIPREAWEFQFFDYGIYFDGDMQLVYNRPVSFDVIVPAELGVLSNSVHIYYRQGGASRYQSAIAEASDDTTYSVALSADALQGLRGLEYYVEMVTAGGDTITYPQLDPYNNPLTSVIRHSGVKASAKILYRKYNLISVPFMLSNTSVDSVLADFGPYNPYKWELFWWDPIGSEERWSAGKDTIYYHVTDSVRFEFTAGRACWFASSRSIDFSVGAGATVTTDSSFQLKLAPGWNMIGNPFNFNVAWQSCNATDSLTGLYHYDYSLSDGPILNWTVLQPWKGYWVYNLVEDTVVLSIPPRETNILPQAGARAAKRSSLRSTLSEGCTVTLAARTADSRDMFNYAGIRYDAAAEWDIYDQPEPPVFEEAVNLTFNRTGWSVHPGFYAADFRPPGGEGQIWEFDVDMPAGAGQVTLSWEIENSLPEGWDACLFVLDDGYGLDMYDVSLLNCRPLGSEQAVRFRMILGTAAFIQENSDGMSTQPVEFTLHRNYPNPFNPETTIAFSIPGKTNVELIVYNALGQKVRTLVDEVKKAGEYQVLWNGRDGNDRAVASGVYICRLKTDRQSAVQKMVLIR
ncbi:choice-of-anchor D domain-containing protein [bacterium]|nr:choice-of-anchor D domain-containing protein [bacterium]